MLVNAQLAECGGPMIARGLRVHAVFEDADGVAWRLGPLEFAPEVLTLRAGVPGLFEEFGRRVEKEMRAKGAL